MSKWLVPLIIAGIVCGLMVSFLVRSPSPGEKLPSETAAAVELPAAWDGLPVNAFLERASGALVIREPEVVTHLGLGEVLGIGNGELTPLAASYELETNRLQLAVVERLESYDLAEVSAADRLSARVYGHFLEDLADWHSFTDHTYLVQPSISSYPESLERFLTATHPMRSDQDAVDYVHRLSQIGDRYAELIVRLQASEAIGAVPPRFILSMALERIREMADVAPTDSPLYTVFEGKLSGLPGLFSDRRSELLSQVEVEIERSVLPAYRRLADHVADMVQQASEDAGAWRHVDGNEYYAYLLRHYTTTDLSADEIHEIGLAEVARIRDEIRAVAVDLGLDPSLSLVDLFAHITESTGTVTGDETRDSCENLLGGITERVSPAFARMPQQDLVVVSGSASAFYSSGSLDGSRPGLFYAPTEVETPRYRLPTLTHHEAVPGHHFQISFSHEADIPIYRAGLSFTAYAEGWALYAERLAWELGAFEDDPHGNLGRLQDELFRAVRLVVDTGIHAMRWTYEEAVDYMIENAGLAEEYVRSQVVRYIVLPGQATAYKIGMLRFLELRQRAETALGAAFDLAEFHDRVLREGSVPLNILEELVDAYIAEQGSS